ncbi:MAG TPA: hypothetical protein VGD26_12655 [Chitinophagaceae bacterium]
MSVKDLRAQKRKYISFRESEVDLVLAALEVYDSVDPDVLMDKARIIKKMTVGLTPEEVLTEKREAALRFNAKRRKILAERWKK